MKHPLGAVVLELDPLNVPRGTKASKAIDWFHVEHRWQTGGP